jgi:hypothetical protein
MLGVILLQQLQMQTNDFSLIKKVLDKYFDFMRESGDYAFASMTEYIPEVMLDKSKKEDDEGYSFWLPIESTVTDKEISDLEILFRHRLPDSFKYFLKQRHFMELDLEQNANFFPVLPGRLVSTFKKIIDTFYWTFSDRNYLPFASYGDWGVLCFNANKQFLGNEYEIVILDHDDEYQESQFYSDNFLKMFQLFDKELDEEIQNVHNFRKNNA